MCNKHILGDLVERIIHAACMIYVHEMRKGNVYILRKYLNVDREVLCFHPAKVDEFKDEKFSEYKTVSVAQSKNCWSRGIRSNF